MASWEPKQLRRATPPTARLIMSAELASAT